jgi:carbonic anhydrase
MRSKSSCSGCQLRRGNAEFVHNPRYKKERPALVNGQEPCSVIVCCSDSRVPPEIVFNETDLGRLFVVRTAGQSLDACAIESIEYALSVLNVTRVVVLGHEDCGAVIAVYDIVADEKECDETGIPCICNHIRPAIVNNPRRTREENIIRSIKRNVLKTVRKIVAETTAKPEIVYGAYYHLASGKVRWLSHVRANSDDKKKQKPKQEEKQKPKQEEKQKPKPKQEEKQKPEEKKPKDKKNEPKCPKKQR